MKMKIFAVLFLALLAQGEDLHPKLTELPSKPKANWLNTNEVAVQMATSGRSVSLASNNQTNFPPVTTTEWTTKEEIIKMAGRRQVNLTYNGTMPLPGFPDKLRIGSREVLRDYIVATNGMGMNVWLTLQYYKSTGGYSKLNIGRLSHGHPSFKAMLEDAEPGFDLLIEALMKKADYKVGSDIWAQVSVTYFNDRNDIEANPFGLSLPRNQGVRDTLNSKRIAESFLSSDPTRDMEIMVAPFPPIKKFELQLSLTNNAVATMTWTKESGAQLASWPKEFPEKIKEQYIAISGWLCYYDRQMRMKISTAVGEETYTEHGDRLSKPTVMAFKDGDTLVIDCPRGADILVQSTTDLVTWTDRGIVSDVYTGRLFLDLPNEGDMMVFRAGVR